MSGMGLKENQVEERLELGTNRMTRRYVVGGKTICSCAGTGGQFAVGAFAGIR